MTKAKDQPDVGAKYVPNMFKDTPPLAVRIDWETVAKRLRSSPMEWWKVLDQGRISIVNAIRQGRIAEVHPDLGFEVYTANNKRTSPRVSDMWMRYNPDKASDLREAVRAAKRGK